MRLAWVASVCVGPKEDGGRGTWAPGWGGAVGRTGEGERGARDDRLAHAEGWASPAPLRGGADSGPPHAVRTK